jgi:Sulfocyanin (SoxE) domain
MSGPRSWHWRRPNLPVGESKTLELNLEPGKYALVCNISGHYAAGMYADFTVKSSRISTSHFPAQRPHGRARTTLVALTRREWRAPWRALPPNPHQLYIYASSSKPVRSGSPRLGRFDSCAAPLEGFRLSAAILLPPA